MSSTNLCNIPYPNENDDPYMDGFNSMMTWFDNTNFALLNTVANVLIPPSNLLWDASSGILTWDTDFILPILSSGFQFAIRYGPDAATRMLKLDDGDIVVVTAPFTSASNIVGNFSVIKSGKLAYQQGLFIFGMRYGTRFVANIPQVFT